MLIVTAKSQSGDDYIFKIDVEDMDFREVQERVDNYAREVGDYSYEDDYSCIDIIDVYNIDDIPELLDYTPINLNDYDEECDY